MRTGQVVAVDGRTHVLAAGRRTVQHEFRRDLAVVCLRSHDDLTVEINRHGLVRIVFIARQTLKCVGQELRIGRCDLQPSDGDFRLLDVIFPSVGKRLSLSIAK